MMLFPCRYWPGIWGGMRFGGFIREHVASPGGDEPAEPGRCEGSGLFGDGNPEIRESGISKLGEL
jgi:hypothetical protein